MNVKNLRSKLAIAATSLLLFSLMPVAAMAAVPFINSISPSGVTAGGSAFTLTVSGSNFEPNSVIYVNGSAKVTGYTSSAQLWAVVNASEITIPGAFYVNVVNPGLNGGTSNNIVLFVNGVAMNNSVPALFSISPSMAMAGSGSFILTLNGSNFIPGSQVRFNGLLRATTYVSANRLTAVIPASDITTAVNDAVSVENPLPGGGQSNALLFTVIPVSGVPGLPNTGFGLDDPKPTANNTLLAIGGFAILSILSLAIVAVRKLWTVKR